MYKVIAGIYRYREFLWIKDARESVGQFSAANTA